MFKVRVFVLLFLVSDLSVPLDSECRKIDVVYDDGLARKTRRGAGPSIAIASDFVRAVHNPKLDF